MATTVLVVYQGTGKTLQATLFPKGNDTASLSNQNLTELTNTKGKYTLNVTATIEGLFTVIILESSVAIDIGEVYLQDTTDTCEVLAPGTALNSIFSAYPDKAIHFDQVNGTAGTRVGFNGTMLNPCSTWANTIIVAEALGYKHIKIKEWSTGFQLSKNTNEYIFEGTNQLQSLPSSFFNGFTVQRCIFKGFIATIDDVGSITLSMFVDCFLTGVTMTDGGLIDTRFLRCGLRGDIIFKQGTFFFQQCYYTENLSSGSVGPLKFSFTNATDFVHIKIYLMDWKGDITLTALDSSGSKFIVYGTGTITLDTTCINGEIFLSEGMKLVDSSSGNWTGTVNRIRNETDLYAVINNDLTETTSGNLSKNISQLYDLDTTTTKTVNDIGTGGGDATAANQSTIIANIGSLNNISESQVNAQVDVALSDIRLDHLLLNAVSDSDVTNNSVFARLVSKSATANWGTFDNTTESLEALRDRGDSSWLTATGFSTLTQTDIRTAVGLASANLDTQLGDIPTNTELNARTLLSTEYVSNSIYTSTRAGYLDNLNVGGNVASQADVQSITVSSRVRVCVPPAMEIPDSGSTAYRIYIYSYNELGQAEDLDSNPTVTAENNTASDRSANLGTVTKEPSTTGIYRVDYTVASTHSIEGIVIKVDATENSVTTTYCAQTMKIDSAVGGFTSSDRTILNTIAEDTTTDIPTLINSRSLLAADYVQQSNLPANFGDLSITVTTGRVSVGTNNDKTGYSIAGTKTVLDDLTDLTESQVNAQTDLALNDYDGPTNTEMTSAFAEIKGAGYNQTTDSLAAQHDDITTILESSTVTIPALLNIIDQVVDAIKLKTDQLSFNIANKVDANTRNINDAEVLGIGTEANKWRGE